MASPKRDAICDAALELFARQGIESTTTREIAERAGAAEGTIYRHFQTKDELVDWLFDACADRFAEVLRASVEEETAPRPRLRRLIRGVFDFADQHPTAFTYLLSVHHTGLLERRREPPPPMRLFVETLRDGVQQGSFRPLSPALATGWIVAMAQRAVVFAASDLVSDTRAEVVEQTVAAALRLVDAEEQ